MGKIFCQQKFIGDRFTLRDSQDSAIITFVRLSDFLEPIYSTLDWIAFS